MYSCSWEGDCSNAPMTGSDWSTKVDHYVYYVRFLTFSVEDQSVSAGQQANASMVASWLPIRAPPIADQRNMS
jgi:hypothetical protein